jgi:hypothetical protein
MNRREMLQHGFQSLNKILATILSAVGGMEGWLNGKENDSSRVRPMCFAGSRKKRTDPDVHQTACQEESK